MKVLHVVGGLAEQGGVFSVVTALASQPHSRTSHEVWMHRHFIPGDWACAYRRQGIVKSVTGTILHDVVGAIFEAIPLWRYVKQNKPMVLHAHSRLGMIAASLVSQLTTVPLVVHVHVLARHRSLYQWLWKQTQPVLVFNSDKTCRHYGFDPCSSIVVYPSIHWPATPASVSANNQRLVSAGLYVPSKQFAHTLNAVITLSGQGLPVSCIIFGKQDNPVDATCTNHLQDLSRNKQYITLAPWSGAWTDELMASDVFVHMGSPESFGIVILEAFARGLQLVIRENTFIDSLPEPHRTSGIFRVQSLSGESLLEQIQLALHCSIPASELWQARREVAPQFDPSQMSRRLTDIYRSLMTSPKARAG